MPESVMSRLKREREKANLTQAVLARFSGVAQPTISKLELGRLKNPGFDVLNNLAWALKKCGRKVDAADLLPKRQLVLIQTNRVDRRRRVLRKPERKARQSA